MSASRKLSGQASRLLHALADDAAQWRHGYELLKLTGLKSGTLYPLLIRLHDQGLVEAQWQEPAVPGRPRRHAYRLTRRGMQAAAASATAEEPPRGKAARPMTA